MYTQRDGKKTCLREYICGCYCVFLREREREREIHIKKATSVTLVSETERRRRFRFWDQSRVLPFISLVFFFCPFSPLCLPYLEVLSFPVLFWGET